MRGKKAKIQITASEMKGLYFVDIYLPKVEDPHETPNFSINHHEDYLHLFFHTTQNPAYIYKGENTYYESLDDKLFSDYDVVNFWDLNDSELS